MAETQFPADMYQGVLLVRDHIEKWAHLVDGVITRPSTGNRDSHLRGLFYRSRGWVKSLAKLDYASDFQAIACSTRSLLEIAVDMLLLHIDQTDKSGWKMKWWDLSAKLQMAIASAQYNNEIGRTDSEDFQAQKKFIGENAASINEQRSNLWPTCVDKKGAPKHPQRWTGDWDILKDIKTVDAACRDLIQENLGTGLVDFYQSHYRLINRSIHGSGLIGVEGSRDILSIRTGIGYWSSASLAMLCTQVILLDLNFTEHLPELLQEWKNIRFSRATNFIEHSRRLAQEDFS